MLEPVVAARASLQFELPPRGAPIRVGEACCGTSAPSGSATRRRGSRSVRGASAPRTEEVRGESTRFYGGDLGLTKVHTDEDFDFAIIAVR